jgi:hypothetical protein
MDELAHSCPGVKQRLDRQSIAARSVIGGVAQRGRLGAIQPLQRPPMRARGTEMQRAPHLRHDLHALVVGEMMLAPELYGVLDHQAQRLRLGRLDAKSGVLGEVGDRFHHPIVS